MTNFTHHANANEETLGNPHGHNLGTSQGSSSTASLSKSAGTHCGHMSKQSKPIKEEVVEVEEEWDY